MIELTYEQARMLRNLMGSTKNFLSTVDGVPHVLAVRDMIIGDCENWQRILLEKMDRPPLSGVSR